jgi:hypothetical protein
LAHYLPIYERHFEKFRGMASRILEIGVAHGGSLQLWKWYFGEQAMIHGLDIDARCIRYEEDQISIYCGNQSDDCVLAFLADLVGPFDLIIDDGSHRPEDQAISFKALWPTLAPGGVYLIEDCHACFPALEYGDEKPLGYSYPWVMVLEKPKRIVTGTPSRPLNSDEREAYGRIDDCYSHA